MRAERERALVAQRPRGVCRQPPGYPGRLLPDGPAGMAARQAEKHPARLRSIQKAERPKGWPRRTGPPLTLGAKRPRHGLEVHVTAAGGGRCLLLLRLLGDHYLGGEEETGDGSGVLQRGTGDLGWVDDPRLEHVDVLAVRGVEAVPSGERLHLLGHHAALEAGVDRDLLDRLLDRSAHDGGTGGLVA